MQQGPQGLAHSWDLAREEAQGAQIVLGHDSKRLGALVRKHLGSRAQSSTLERCDVEVQFLRWSEIEIFTFEGVKHGS